MKLSKETLKVKLELLTGLHIGSGNDKLQIGGVDSAVIKDPVSKLPYIPGSSLKGKIRCLLETEGKYKGELDEKLNVYFGFNNSFIKENDSKKEGKTPESPTRIIFRDLFLCETDKEKFLKGAISTEFKTEIVIDRQKGKAKDGGLRTIERVPRSMIFEGDIVIRYAKKEELEEIKSTLGEAIELLNNDYLGGSGSRGYGAVKITLN